MRDDFDDCPKIENMPIDGKVQFIKIIVICRAKKSKFLFEVKKQLDRGHIYTCRPTTSSSFVNM